MWLPEEMMSTPASNISRAVRRLRPRPPAAFSPLAITTSRLNSRRKPGSIALRAFRPGSPTTSPMKNMRKQASLAGNLRGAGLAHDGYLDLAGILHRLLDLLAYVAGQA